MQPPPALPVDAVLPELTAALAAHGRAVLVAPPGAGKTTRVPLALLDAVPGPHRHAGTAPPGRPRERRPPGPDPGRASGGPAGYRIRGEFVPGSRIEVVTEGILTRMLQSDPPRSMASAASSSTNSTNAA